MTGSPPMPTGRILVVVAHPDDESFLFGGRMLERPDLGWDVVVVTDGAASAPPDVRLERLQRAAILFGFTLISFGAQPDIEGGRLDIRAMVGLLSAFPKGTYDAVWTHSPLGDYQAHLHHQDVAVACALVFGGLVRYAGIGFLEGRDGHNLSRSCYHEKLARLFQCYPEESACLEGDFLMFVHEDLIAIDDSGEVVQIYAWLVGPAVADIVSSDERFLDLWRHGMSFHEAEVVSACTSALTERGLHAHRTLVVGDPLGVLCEAILSAGATDQVDAMEPCRKHFESLSLRGARPVLPEEARLEDYDAVHLFEPSCSTLLPRVPEILAVCPARFVLYVDSTSEHPPSLLDESTFSVERCFNLPQRFEFGAHSSFPFRFPATTGWIARRTG